MKSSGLSCRWDLAKREDSDAVGVQAGPWPPLRPRWRPGGGLSPGSALAALRGKAPLYVLRVTKRCPDTAIRTHAACAPAPDFQLASGCRTLLLGSAQEDQQKGSGLLTPEADETERRRETQPRGPQETERNVRRVCVLPCRPPGHVEEARSLLILIGLLSSLRCRFRSREAT